MFIKPDGQSCQANPMRGSDFCFRHNPEQKNNQVIASQSGGLNRRLQGEYGQEIILNGPKDINMFLGKVINAVWTGAVPVQVGSSMGFLARCWLDAYEVAEVDKRIEEIEKKLEEAEK